MPEYLGISKNIFGVCLHRFKADSLNNLGQIIRTGVNFEELRDTRDFAGRVIQ